MLTHSFLFDTWINWTLSTPLVSPHYLVERLIITLVRHLRQMMALSWIETLQHSHHHSCILRSFRHTQHHFCISFEKLFILGLNDPPNWHLVDFKSDHWTGCWVFVVKRWTMIRIQQSKQARSTLDNFCIVKMNFGDIALFCVPYIYQVVELLVMIGGIISLWWLFQFQWRKYSIILKIPSFTDDKVQNAVERVQAAGNPSLLTFPPNFRPCRPKLQNPADKCKICWKYKRR